MQQLCTAAARGAPGWPPLGGPRHGTGGTRPRCSPLPHSQRRWLRHCCMSSWCLGRPSWLPIRLAVLQHVCHVPPPFPQLLLALHRHTCKMVTAYRWRPPPYEALYCSIWLLWAASGQNQMYFEVACNQNDRMASGCSLRIIQWSCPFSAKSEWKLACTRRLHPCARTHLEFQK